MEMRGYSETDRVDSISSLFVLVEYRISLGSWVVGDAECRRLVVGVERRTDRTERLGETVLPTVRGLPFDTEE